jgi:hypothetical protein
MQEHKVKGKGGAQCGEFPAESHRVGVCSPLVSVLLSGDESKHKRSCVRLGFGSGEPRHVPCIVKRCNYQTYGINTATIAFFRVVQQPRNSHAYVEIKI